ncbi:MAG: hypothetical protein QF741_03575 [Candidatus Peribacteraceae bacterium]|jgi:hypothetical protein|nr:hypothetical protein [Candidatus Peribacteraceae bacterium]MDP7454325.1 hypothetical protein [Candidatus Peribacteraceae bacterium]MDP7645723.1 hypothetical protein [Candidatus Peribacteraceae bacterium]|tara:strand:- start:102 stop:791 length:690 start_codon:yes stop_codon:yes gene_type:complete
MKKSFLIIGLSVLLVGCNQEGSQAPKGTSYTNEEAGFKLTFPEGVELLEPEHLVPSSTGSIALAVRVDSVDALEEAGLYSKRMAEEVMKNLGKGELGPGLDFEEEKSEKIVSLGKLNAREGMIFARFEICDVTFERILVFYPKKNDKTYQVVLNLSMPDEKMIEAFPAYFHKDSANCGDELVWIQQAETGENMRIFSKFHHYEVMANEHPLIKEWNGAFKEIKESIKFN